MRTRIGGSKAGVAPRPRKDNGETDAWHTTLKQRMTSLKSTEGGGGRGVVSVEGEEECKRSSFPVCVCVCVYMSM